MKRSALGAAFLLAACFDAAAQPWGPELRINTTTAGSQYYPSVAGLSDSQFVVVWGSTTAVYGQRMNMITGAPVGAEFVVSATSYEHNPSVGTDIAGVFVVAFAVDTDSLEDFEVYARRYNFNGEPLGASLYRVNTATTGAQSAPRVTTFGNRQFAVAWQDQIGIADPDVEAQLFASTGAPAGSELRVNTFTTERQQVPAVAGWHNQGFVVAWTDFSAGYGVIVGQRFSPQGQPVASLRLSDYTSQSQTTPSVASDAAGNFVAVWEDSGRDGSQRGIFGRRFSASGSPLGPEFRVNTSTAGEQLRPAVAADISGSFLVAWESPGVDGTEIYKQEFDPAGHPRGGEVRVNTYTTGTQRSVQVATGYRNFVVVWHGPGESDREIYAQRFCFRGDVDGDGFLTVSDVLYMINRLFAGGPPPATYCPSVNGDEVLNVSDVLYLINHLFAGGPAPV